MVLDATHVTMIVTMIADMKEMAMMTGVTTDHIDDDLRLHTTRQRTGLGQDPGLILPGDIDLFWLAGISSLFKDKQEIHLRDMVDFAVDFHS